jgi:putative phage-type endonuclease
MFAQQRTPQWHQERRGKVTASVCGSILGVNKHQSHTQLWKQLTGNSEPFTGNMFTEYGTLNEPNALNEYCVQTGNRVEETGFIVHPRYKWLGGSPDGLVRSDGVVEFKCPWYKTKKMYTTDTIPLQYFVQCQVLMEITDRSWCDLFVWHPEENRRWRFNRDKPFFNMICSSLAQFHAHMVTNTETPSLTTIEAKDRTQFVKNAMRESLVSLDLPSKRIFSEVDTSAWSPSTKQRSTPCSPEHLGSQ